MKKGLGLVLGWMIFIICPLIVNALPKEEMLQMEYSKLFEFERPTGFLGFQGMIVTDKYIVVAAINNDSVDNTTLVIFDKNTFEFSSVNGNSTAKYSFGHANDMAYNAEMNEIYVINGQKIHVLDSNTFEHKEDRNISDGSYVGIAYDSVSETYYFRNHEKLFIYDSTMNQQSSFSIPTNLTRQAISVNKNKLYYSCYENGAVSKDQVKYDGVLEKGANLIYVYDFLGTLENAIYIPSGLGELEAMEFDESGIPYLLFNTLNNKGAIYVPVFESQSEKFTVKDDTSVTNAVAELSNKNGIIETVALKNGVYQFKPITFNEPGTYEYTITRFDEDEPEEQDVQSRTLKNDTVEVVVTVEYNASINQLETSVTYNQDTFTYEELEKPSTNIPGESDNQQVIDTTINPGQSSNEVPEPGTVENPQTGAFIPIYIIPIALGIVTGVILYKRKIFFRL